eukprot:1159990-Pelagomonas_calceolata.AAC.10
MFLKQKSDLTCPVLAHPHSGARAPGRSQERLECLSQGETSGYCTAQALGLEAHGDRKAVHKLELIHVCIDLSGVIKCLWRPAHVPQEQARTADPVLQLARHGDWFCGVRVWPPPGESLGSEVQMHVKMRSLQGAKVAHLCAKFRADSVHWDVRECLRSEVHVHVEMMCIKGGNIATNGRKIFRASAVRWGAREHLGTQMQQC